MGLDIYLRKCKDREAVNKLEKQYEDQAEENWMAVGGYTKATEEQRKSVSAQNDKLAKKLGLGKYGSSDEKVAIEQNSAKYPDHMFKVGYFRSSYNEGGINRVLSRLGIDSLHEIFDHQGEDYEFVPDWEKSLERVKKSITRLKKFSSDKIDVTVVETSSLFSKPDCINEFRAREIFQKQVEQHKGGSFDSYSCRDGVFYLGEPMKVKALIPGTRSVLRKNEPCVYVVYETKEGFDWYVNALEIVQETIEFVLAQKDRNIYYMCWSG